MAPNERPCRTFGWPGSKPDGAHQAFNRHRPRGDAKREQQHVDALLSRQVDGLIVVGADTHPRPSLGTNLPVPVVYAYAPSTDPMDVSVTADNAGAAAMAIDHLLACGRRNVAHISGDRAHKSAQDRAQGATAALAAAGASLVGDGALFGSWNEVWGRGAARMLVERHPDIDGILCGSDQVARSVLDALRDMGKNVPADIAVVGLDNREVLASSARPGLTSVDMNLHRIGATAAKSLVNAIDGTPPRGEQTVPCRLVVRGSTAPHD